MTSASGKSMHYDADKRLYQVNGGNRFMYDGQDMITEINANVSVVRRYVHGPNVDDPIVWYEGAGTINKLYYHENHQGSIIGITNSGGNNYAINAYAEYGISAGSNIGRYGYTGQVYLSEVGLYYYKARIYSPTLGRFMQTDPIGYKDGMNWYAYVGNDPINFLDIQGRARITVGLSYTAVPIATRIGGAFEAKMSLDTESLEVGVEATSQIRIGVAQGGSLLFNVEKSSYRGNSYDANLNADITLGTGEESVNIMRGSVGLDGEFSSSLFDIDTTTSFDSSDFKIGINAGLSAGAGATLKANMSMPDTVKYLENVFNELNEEITKKNDMINSVIERCYLDASKC